MALFGDLKHQTLADLAKVIHIHTGTLLFHSAYQGKTVELVLNRGHLHAMYLDGFPIQDLTQARAILHQLHVQGHGAFELHRQTLLVGDVRLYDQPFADLVYDIVESTLPGMPGPVVPADQLPHPDTRFTLTPQSPPVPASLVQLWARVQPHLAQGSSAAELAPRLDLSPHDMQTALYRLRALDLITPQRAAVSRPASVAHHAPMPQGPGGSTVDDITPVTLPPTSPAPRLLVQRLLGALRRFTQGGAA
ncbi:hypothetical protein [Deinococcus humi]|uniref:DUF4388 domain-containing protein n=1 Tax=Deinococcus humi TaxID=662880 RepID=A0A7W8JZ06_9DEIO|nr:hypothetical protein [Deinococcus humi]MBB5365817.1 hypothetical protein [Deinococcus humi]GGO39345.1 hypothetical protein GCM10008949_47300 [Deinococcus humi]